MMPKLVVVVELEISLQAAELFFPLLEENARLSLQNEDGCNQFDACIDPERPTCIFLYEVYDNSAAFEAHLQSSHYRIFDENTRRMILGKKVRFLEPLT